MAKKKAEKAESVYKVTLKVGDLVYSEAGETLLDCFDKLAPQTIKGKSLLTAEKNGKTFQVALTVFEVRRFVVNKIYRQLLEKRFNTVLN